MFEAVQVWLHHIRILFEDIGPRGSTTEGERHGAEYCAQVLKHLGLSPQVEPFTSARSIFQPHLLASIAMLIAFSVYPLAGRASAIAAAAISLLALGSDLLELSFRANKEDIVPIERPWHSEMKDAYRQNQTIRKGEKLSIPIRVRGHVIGVIDTHRAEGDIQWTEDDVSLLEGVADQLGVALDSARLYAETQQRAEQERLVGEITGHMRQSLDVEAVLKTAVEEIYRALNLENLVIQLAPQEKAVDIETAEHKGGGDGRRLNSPDENPPSSVLESNP